MAILKASGDIVSFREHKFVAAHAKKTFEDMKPHMLGKNFHPVSIRYWSTFYKAMREYFSVNVMALEKRLVGREPDCVLEMRPQDMKREQSEEWNEYGWDEVVLTMQKTRKSAPSSENLSQVNPRSRNANMPVMKLTCQLETNRNCSQLLTWNHLRCGRKWIWCCDGLAAISLWKKRDTAFSSTHTRAK